MAVLRRWMAESCHLEICCKLYAFLFHPLLRGTLSDEMFVIQLLTSSQLVELMATMSLCYLSALIDTTMAGFKTLHLPAYAGVSNIFLLSLFIYATAPASGGHVNPLITFSTVTTGLTAFPRGALYIICQTIGAGIAGGLIRGSFGQVMTQQ